VQAEPAAKHSGRHVVEMGVDEILSALQISISGNTVHHLLFDIGHCFILSQLFYCGPVNLGINQIVTVASKPFHAGTAAATQAARFSNRMRLTRSPMTFAK
jgi:hypothetical protein